MVTGNLTIINKHTLHNYQYNNSSEKYYLPLHPIKHVSFEANGHDPRLYICPKFEYPSVE